MNRIAATFIRAAPPRIIDQNAAHHPRRDREKMGAIFPVWLVLAAQPEIHLMD